MPVRHPLWLGLCAALLCAGCHELNLSKMFDREAIQQEQLDGRVSAAIRGEKGYSRLIGDYIRIADAGYVKVEAVGLVERLEGRGENPPASYLRTMLLEDMRRHKVENPESILASGDTCLVIVTAYIPPVIKKHERIDVEISLPEGSKVKSLSGGYLLPCFLREHLPLDGIREGKELVLANGPILVDAVGGVRKGESSTAGHLHGRIPAGGKYIDASRNLSIGVANDVRSVRMTQQIATSIGSRFHDYNEHGLQVPMAEAKNDVRIELLVPRFYVDNTARYLQVIRSISLRENAVDRHVRMGELAEQIQHGPTAEVAALQLEAIGTEGIPALKKGLSSPDLEARFHAAAALAYLGEPAGVPALQEAIEQEPAFRIYAFAALATLPDGATFEALKELMNNPSVETRYGAFRAYSTLAADDPAVAGVELGGGSFQLHAVESSGPALVHLTRFKKCEVVVFGRQQRLLTPVVLRAGDHIIVQNTPDGAGMTVKRIAAGDMQERQTSSRLVDVIRAAAELGAMYPDIVQLLVQAQNQKNLAGAIAIDELPRPGRPYKRPGQEGSVQVGGAALQPNLFEQNESPPPLAAAAVPDAVQGNSTEMFATE